MCVSVLTQIYLGTQTQKLLTPNKQVEWNSLLDGVRWSTLFQNLLEWWLKIPQTLSFQQLPQVILIQFLYGPHIKTLHN